MKVFKIGKRWIHAPNRKEKLELRKLIPTLEKAERQAAIMSGVSHIAHGFIKGRSPVTAALVHVGDFVATISMDLKGWFDSVSCDQIAYGLRLADISDIDSYAITNKICVNGSPRQGLPTSPLAANIAAVPFDQSLLHKLPEGAAYTRYADDITISVKLEEDISKIKHLVTETAHYMEWSVSDRKTKVYLAKGGNRTVLGIAVGSTGLVPTRTTKRKLRSATYQFNRNGMTKNLQSIKGLNEWMKLKRPKNEVLSQSLLEYFSGLIDRSSVKFDIEGGFAPN